MLERGRFTKNPVFGLIWVGCFFAGLMTFALHNLYRDWEFDQSTHRSQATVEHAWSSIGHKGSTHYHVRFHFNDDQNRRWTVTVNGIAPGTYRSVKTGALVPVKYLADNPGLSRIDWPNETQYHWHQDKVLFYVALGIGVIWALIFGSNRRGSSATQQF